jgi:hypothetical protein
MSEPSISPTVFHFLERSIGKKVAIILDRDFGYEGNIEAISHAPPGIWLTDADAIILRSTVANPIPRVVTREKKSEIFIHLNAVHRVEILPQKKG